MRINSNGNIGINYTSAAPYSLSVKGTISRLGSTGIQIINLGSNSDHGQLTSPSETTRVALNSNGDDSYINAGNFGIGITTPPARLTVRVDGNANTDQLRVENSSGRI